MLRVKLLNLTDVAVHTNRSDNTYYKNVVKICVLCLPKTKAKVKFWTNHSDNINYKKKIGQNLCPRLTENKNKSYFLLIMSFFLFFC